MVKLLRVPRVGLGAASRCPIDRLDAVRVDNAGGACNGWLVGAIERERVTYRTVAGVRLSLWVVHRADSESNPVSSRDHYVRALRRAVILFHGGGWAHGSPDQLIPLAEALAQTGLVACVPEYRVKTRHRSRPIDAFVDCAYAVSWIVDNCVSLGVDGDGIFAVGASAGGQIAARLAQRDPFPPVAEAAVAAEQPGAGPPRIAEIRALALLNPVLDLGPDGYGNELWGDAWCQFSPLHMVSGDDPPTLVFVGDADTVTPPEQALRYALAMRAAGRSCRVVVYPGCRHGFFASDQPPSTESKDAQRQILRFFSEFR